MGPVWDYWILSVLFGTHVSPMYLAMVWCHYNVVKFLQNPHNKHPIACSWLGLFCESGLWFMLCLNHCGAVCSIMSNWTMLQWHPAVSGLHWIRCVCLACLRMSNICGNILYELSWYFVWYFAMCNIRIGFRSPVMNGCRIWHCWSIEIGVRCHVV